MIVNVLFFAVVSVFALKLKQQVGSLTASAVACMGFLILVLFGEILPKSIAYINSKSISIATSMPTFLCIQIFSPIIFIFRFLIVEPALRLILGPKESPSSISSSEFKTLIEQSRKHGLITADQDKLLAEIIELGFLKVRHVVRPRVDMAACDISDSPVKARQIMLENNLTKLPVYSGTIDNITGMINLRRLLLEPDVPLDKLIQKVHYVPEQKTVESLLEFFRKNSIDSAIVVDEYGQIAGLVQLEDIAEELFGPIEISAEIKPIEQTGPLEYRLAGDLAIQDWADAFGVDPAETRIATLAGLVTAALGKIPQPGDVVYLKNLKFTVEAVQKRRIQTIILTLEPIAAHDK